MAYLEFCCRSGGSNYNAGTLTGNSTEPGTSATYTYAGSFATNTFTVSAGNPLTDGVVAGMFIHVSTGAAIGRIAIITSVTSTTIVLSATRTVGSGTGATQAKIGGAFEGPTATDVTLINSNLYALTTTGAGQVRVNLKNAATFNVAAAINGVTLCLYEGYATSYGDGGKATIANTTAGAIHLIQPGVTVGFKNLILDHSVSTTAGHAVSNANAGCIYIGVVVKGSGGNGFNLVGSCAAIDCQAYNCGIAGAPGAGAGGFVGSGTTGQKYFERCISHSHNSGLHGFTFVGTSVAVNCVAHNNPGRGFFSNAVTSYVTLLNCDAYANTGDGFNLSSTRSVSASNCNAALNGGYGFNGLPGINYVQKCKFGTGTQANSLGGTNFSTDIVTPDATGYSSDVSPWVNASTGDFRISHTEAKGQGWGGFTQTGGVYSGTIGYPDIGAAQSSSASSGGGLPIARGMHGGMR